MTLKHHTVVTAVASAALVPFWGWPQIAAFWVGSVLIDVDHYLYFIWRRKRFGVREMFQFHDEIFLARHQIPYAGICVFHTVDCFVVAWVLSLFFPIFQYLLVGLLFHFVIDLVHLYRHDYLFGRAFFFAEHFVRKRRHPRYPYFR